MSANTRAARGGNTSVDRTLPPQPVQHRGSVLQTLLQNPLVLFIGGAFILAIFVVCWCTQIQTTEAWLLGRQPSDTGFTWSMFYQFVGLFQGKFVGKEEVVDAACWAAEVITLIFGTSFEKARAGVARSSEMAHFWFTWATLGIIILNGVTDYQYAALPSGFIGQFFVAIVISFVTIFGLPVGIELIASAIKSYRR